MSLSHRILAGIVTGVLLGSLLAGTAFKSITAVATVAPGLPAVDLSPTDFTEVASACDNATAVCTEKSAQQVAIDEFNTPRQLTVANSEKRAAQHEEVVLVSYSAAGDSGDSGIVAVSLDSSDDTPGSGWTRGINYSGYQGAGNNSIATGNANSAQQLVAISNLPGTFVPSGSAPLPIPVSVVPAAGTAPGKALAPPLVVPVSAPSNTPAKTTIAIAQDHYTNPTPPREHTRKRRPLVPSLLPDFVPHFTRIPPADSQMAIDATAVNFIWTASLTEIAAATVILDTPLAGVVLFAALNDLSPTGAGPGTSVVEGAALRIESLAIPAPASIILIGLGLAALGFSRRKRA